MARSGEPDVRGFLHLLLFAAALAAAGLLLPLGWARVPLLGVAAGLVGEGVWYDLLGHPRGSGR